MGKQCTEAQTGVVQAGVVQVGVVQVGVVQDRLTEGCSLMRALSA